MPSPREAVGRGNDREGEGRITHICDTPIRFKQIIQQTLRNTLTQSTHKDSRITLIPIPQITGFSPKSSVRRRVR